MAAPRHLVRRLHPDDRAAAQGRRARSWPSGSTTPATSTKGVYEGWYCVGCEAFKQEKDLVDGLCPLHPTTTPEWIREKNYFFRLSKYQQPLLEPLRRRIPSSCSRTMRRNEILRLLEGGLEDISVSRAGQSWGIPLPFDPSSVVYVWFDALINYASAVGLGSDDAMFDTVVAGRSARHRQGHHAVPRRHLAGDADERRAAAAAAGVRPRVRDLQRPADEQVARHGRRSDRGGGAVRRRPAAPVSRQGDRVRRRRRLLVGALRGALQRRPRQQPRQPGEPRRRDGGPIPAAAGWRRPRDRPVDWRDVAEQVVRRLPARDGRPSRCTKARRPRSG